MGIARQAEGRLVAGGYTTPPSGAPWLVRYGVDGTIDGGFASGGVVASPMLAGFYSSGRPTIDGSGRIVASMLTAPGFWYASLISSLRRARDTRRVLRFRGDRRAVPG